MTQASFGAGIDVRELLAGFREIADGFRETGRELRALPAAPGCPRDGGADRPDGDRSWQSRLEAAERKVLQAADGPARGISAAAAGVDRVGDLLAERFDAIDNAVRQLRDSVERLESIVGPARQQTQATATAG